LGCLGLLSRSPILNRGTLNLGASITSPHALRIVIGAALYLTVCSLLGIALGALLRGTAAAVTAVAGLLFILPILMNFLPVSWHRDAIAQWLPSNACIQIIEKDNPTLAVQPVGRTSSLRRMGRARIRGCAGPATAT